MLGHRNAGSGSDQRGRGTDVEGARSVSARPAGVNQLGPLRANRRHVPAHGQRGPSHLADRFPLAPQGRQQNRHFGISAATLHHGVDGVGHVFHRQIVAGQHLAYRVF